MPGPGENDECEPSGDDEPPEPASGPDPSGEEPPEPQPVDTDPTDDHTGDSQGETVGQRDSNGGFAPRDTGANRPQSDRSAKTPSPNQSTADEAPAQRPVSDPRHRDRPTAEPDDEEVSGWLLVSRDVVITVLAVALIGGYLFAVSGVWPPMVAIESGSMEPNMNVNDMVFVMDNDRFGPAAAHGETGVVTAQAGAAVDYTRYGKSGDVIIFEPGGDEDATPIIHRAMLWVEDGERWYDRANESYVGAADSCAELSACPAPHAGFITKGDANSGYDQASLGGSNDPVKPDWVVGTAEIRVPRLGWFRLQL